MKGSPPNRNKLLASAVATAIVASLLGVLNSWSTALVLFGFAGLLVVLAFVVQLPQQAGGLERTESAPEYSVSFFARQMWISFGLAIPFLAAAGWVVSELVEGQDGSRTAWLAILGVSASVVGGIGLYAAIGLWVLKRRAEGRR